MQCNTSVRHRLQKMFETAPNGTYVSDVYEDYYRFPTYDCKCVNCIVPSLNAGPLKDRMFYTAKTEFNLPPIQKAVLWTGHANDDPTWHELFEEQNATAPYVLLEDKENPYSSAQGHYMYRAG